MHRLARIVAAAVCVLALASASAAAQTPSERAATTRGQVLADGFVVDAPTSATGEGALLEAGEHFAP